MGKHRPYCGLKWSKGSSGHGSSHQANSIESGGPFCEWKGNVAVHRHIPPPNHAVMGWSVADAVHAEPELSEENKDCEWVLGLGRPCPGMREWVGNLQRKVNWRTEESQELLVSAVNLALQKLLGLLLPYAFN